MKLIVKHLFLGINNKMLKTLKNIVLLKQHTDDVDVINKMLKLAEKEDIYEVVGMLYKKSSKLGFKSECFEKHLKDEEEYLNLLECPEVEEGMFQCSKCKSKKVFTMSKQTRSGDEATTVFAKCSQCKSGWVIN